MDCPIDGAASAAAVDDAGDVSEQVEAEYNDFITEQAAEAAKEEVRFCFR